MDRNKPIQHIYRWYSSDPEDYQDESNLVTLCWGCAMNRGDTVEHASTPDESEELCCEDCDALNEQGAIWEREMAMYLSGAYDAGSSYF
jgi:hypothetical protein